MAFRLCETCASRFGKSGGISRLENEKECHICRGSLANSERLAKEALASSAEFEWSTFSVASSFQQSVFVREEEVADSLAPGMFTSMKNSLNSYFSEKIAAATGKKNAQRFAEASFEFDFISGKASARPAPAYVFGRYLKLSRKHCQSRWHCSGCGGRGCDACGGSGQNYPSVEDEIGKVLLGAFGGRSCTLHASGREDVDVRSLGTGRPFVMEVKSPKKRGVDLAALEREMDDNPNVRVAGLKGVKPHFVDAVCNSHFDKEYSALVSAERKLGTADAKLVDGLSGAFLFQQTPKRVLARRADLERRRKIYRVSAREEGDGKLRLCIFAEAGTYIKEFIHSDQGRTKPSVSELLGCNTVCEELDVVGIRDFFLETIVD